MRLVITLVSMLVIVVPGLRAALVPSAFAHDGHEQDHASDHECDHENCTCDHSKRDREGRFVYDVRLRWERVSDDARPETANARTVRTRIGYESGKFWGLQAFVEMEDIRPFGGETFDSTSNGRTTYAVVPDPEDTELNRAWIGWSGETSTFKAGRQRIDRDGGRLIGNVGWRQNEQTFDGVTIDETFDRWSFWGAWMTRANRVFGGSHPDGVLRQFDLDAYAVEAAVDTGVGKVTLLGHWFEFENAPSASYRNIGARFVGKRELREDTHLTYRLQYVDQASYKDADPDDESDYIVGSLGVNCGPWTASINVEQLSGDGAFAFKRPLATLHAYNGWADRFLVTPSEGLVDTFVAVGRKIGKYTVGARYHHYESDVGSLDFGSEFGLVAKKSWVGGRGATVLKFTDFSGDSGLLDVQKMWISMEWRSPK